MDFSLLTEKDSIYEVVRKLRDPVGVMEVTIEGKGCVKIATILSNYFCTVVKMHCIYERAGGWGVEMYLHSI